MNDAEQTSKPKVIDPLKKYAVIAAALFGAGCGWYNYPATPLQGLFWGSILGAYTVSVIWNFIDN
jgi:hypothetical protein